MSGKFWLGFCESGLADACYSDGHVWLGYCEGMSADADARYSDGHVWLGYCEGMSADADAYYDGEDDGAAAAAVLLLLSSGYTTGSRSANDEDSENDNTASSTNDEVPENNNTESSASYFHEYSGSMYERKDAKGSFNTIITIIKKILRAVLFGLIALIIYGAVVSHHGWFNLIIDVIFIWFFYVLSKALR